MIRHLWNLEVEYLNNYNLEEWGELRNNFWRSTKRLGYNTQ